MGSAVNVSATRDAATFAGVTSPEGLQHAAAINDADVAAEYVAKLRSELDGCVEAVFGAAPSEKERLHSMLADLGKTGGDFRALATRALEGLADALLPRLRPVLDEAGAVSGAHRRGACHSRQRPMACWVAGADDHSRFASPVTRLLLLTVRDIFKELRANLSRCRGSVFLWHLQKWLW